MATIEVSGAVKAFGGKRALDGATLSVAEGEVYGLAGRNGAGKSTLARLVVGVFGPDVGSVRVGGRDPLRDARARGAGVRLRRAVCLRAGDRARPRRDAVLLGLPLSRTCLFLTAHASALCLVAVPAAAVALTVAAFELAGGLADALPGLGMAACACAMARRGFGDAWFGKAA